MRRAAAVVCAVLAAVLLASCGKSGAHLDKETDRAVSTVTVNGDSFTLPCTVDDFLDKGYTFSRDGETVDLYGMMIPGKSNVGNFYVGKEDCGIISVYLTNPDDVSRPLCECTVTMIIICCGEYRIKHGFTDDWNYMGLNGDSGMDDVTVAFDGIFEMEHRDYESEPNVHELSYYDGIRCIEFYFNKDSSGNIGWMKKILVAIYPVSGADDYPRVIFD